jgi:hypothetical protein
LKFSKMEMARFGVTISWAGRFRACSSPAGGNASRGAVKNKGNFMKRYSLMQIPTDWKVIDGLSELR